jgi:hypothetical protein
LGTKKLPRRSRNGPRIEQRRSNDENTIVEVKLPLMGVVMVERPGFTVMLFGDPLKVRSAAEPHATRILIKQVIDQVIPVGLVGLPPFCGRPIAHGRVEAIASPGQVVEVSGEV